MSILFTSSFTLLCMLSRFNHVWLFATLQTIACQAPLSMEFSRQEYWSGLPCPSPGDLPDPGIEPTSLVSSALAGRFFTTVLSGKPYQGFLRLLESVGIEGAVTYSERPANVLWVFWGGRAWVQFGVSWLSFLRKVGRIWPGRHGYGEESRCELNQVQRWGSLDCVYRITCSETLVFLYWEG